MTKPDYDAVDLSSMGFWSRTADEREESFRVLRDERPVSWHRPAEGVLMPSEDDEGFWAVVRHADVRAVSKNPRTFCSGQGVQFQDVPEELLEASQSFLAMDSPRHTMLRKLVSAAFTPKQVARIDAQIKDQARRIVDELLEVGDCDFVDQVARRLPMWTIYEMVGLPEEQREPVAEAADIIISGNDPEVRGDKDPLELTTEALMALLGPGVELAEVRRAKPGEDLMTNLVQAEVDGQRLTDEEIGAFFVLLSVAGNDTTRNTISHTIKALTDFPEQRALLVSDFDGRIGTAVEEFVRWASPVMTFRRTATEDTELGGMPIAAGDKVVLFYPSANRDERVFNAPMRFDVLRTPNEHVGFGGGGPHFCLGNNLAKAQLRAIFGELLHRAPKLQVGTPELLVSNFVHGVKRMPCTLDG